MRLEARGVDVEHAIELCAFIADQGAPVGGGALEQLALGRERTTAHVVDGLLVDADQTGTRAGLDRHVADGHAAFHRQRADGFAAELDHEAGAAGGADLADDGEHDVLGGDARAELAVDADQHRLGLALDQGLGGQHMLDLGGADAEGQRAKGAVGGGVRIAADDRGARQGEALFGADHMHHALTLVTHAQFGDAEGLAVGAERLDLEARNRIGDAGGAVGGGDVVVRHR